MAQKGKRPLINLSCSVCGEKNYITNRNIINTTEKLELKKFCKKCRKSTLHKETKIAKAKK